MDNPALNRRQLFAGAAVAAGASPALAASPPPAASPGAAQDEAASLYIPKAHLVEDRRLLHDFMESYAFVNLVTASPSIHVTHIPTLLSRDAGPYGTIYGHIARHNPQSATFDGRQPAVIVFQGPEAYISPTWYVGTQVIPTWNFATVHASGVLAPIADKLALHDLLARLIHRFEHSKSAFDFAALPDSYVYPMIENIIGFEMRIERLEGKFKLGQERSPADRQGILAGLATTRPEPGLRELTETFYRTHT